MRSHLAPHLRSRAKVTSHFIDEDTGLQVTKLVNGWESKLSPSRFKVGSVGSSPGSSAERGPVSESILLSKYHDEGQAVMQ